jgi:hypothetical protein
MSASTSNPITINAAVGVSPVYKGKALRSWAELPEEVVRSVPPHAMRSTRERANSTSQADSDLLSIGHHSQYLYPQYMGGKTPLAGQDGLYCHTRLFEYRKTFDVHMPELAES